ncbi:shikimate kinase [Paenibacillus paeoniae]|uniref:Shikimate kinase n=1 Tax=Paenibacillus paeoniae TaxID=2292705 RepID=A0A371PH44_9BACL|nr:shikimate kinase [Paenibacillus paeoniae]REK75259.1 shikimate kinase [Paenibacillus paeoniae]
MNIVLIGMSGAGKSTLGLLLAQALKMDFVDTDLVIEQQEDRLLQDIMDQDGIDHFMAVEEAVLSKLQLNNCMISTGGSAIYSEQAMKALKQNGLVLYLHVSFEEISRRLTNIATRGIVMKNALSLKDVYEERLPLYIKYSDHKIDCSNRDVEQCVREILQVVESKRSM